MPKEVAIYGTFMVYKKVFHRQRYLKWIYRRTGPRAGERWYKKRVWRKVTRRKVAPGKGRYELIGSGRSLTKAIIKIKNEDFVPKGYIRVPADDFLAYPEEYTQDGYWIYLEVGS